MLKRINGVVKVGLLHSSTGFMSQNEQPVINATLLAIEEINKKSGLLRKKLEPCFFDGASQEEIFSQGAKKLLLEEKVAVVFGCWTSSSRKAVKPIFEDCKKLLFYPVQYEGLESSDFIVYTGATPNQQIIPGTKWCLENIGKKLFLVGSDYVFPRTAHLIIRGVAQTYHGQILGEAYLPLGTQEVKDVVQEIKEKKPDIILNTINGNTNQAFFQELRNQGIQPDVIPTMSFCLGEQGFKTYGLMENSVGDYACWNYFQSLDNSTNQDFVQKYQKKYGDDQLIEDPMESAYLGVHLWKMAVEKAKSFETEKVQKAIQGLRISAPEGSVHVSRDGNHIWKFVRIGQLNQEKSFSILWSSKAAVKPEAFPQVDMDQPL